MENLNLEQLLQIGAGVLVVFLLVIWLLVRSSSSKLKQEFTQMRDAFATEKAQLQEQLEQAQASLSERDKKIGDLEILNAKAEKDLSYSQQSEKKYLEQYNKAQEQIKANQEEYQASLEELKATKEKQYNDLQVQSFEFKNQISTLNANLEAKEKELQRELRNHEETLANTKQQAANELEQQKQLLNNELEQQKQLLNNELEQQKQVFSNEIEQQKQAHQNKIEALTKLYDQKLASLNSERESSINLMKQEFKELATNLVKTQADEFESNSKKSFDSITDPISKQLINLAKETKDLLSESTKQDGEFKARLETFDRLIGEVSQQSNKLSTALLGKKKIMGNWGELQLKTLLESAGLHEGIHFNSQTAVYANNSKKIPDFILNLPDHRHLIIDCKTPLTHYNLAVNAATDAEEDAEAKELIKAIETHVNDLAKSGYHDIANLNTPGLVFMYIPIEHVLYYVNKYKPSLISEAQEKKVIIITQSSLLPLINIFNSIWRSYESNNNLKKLVETADNLFSTISGTVEIFVKFTGELSKLNKTYNKLVNKFTSSQGLINRAVKFSTGAVNAQAKLDNLINLQTAIYQDGETEGKSTFTFLDESKINLLEQRQVEMLIAEIKHEERKSLDRADKLKALVNKAKERASYLDSLPAENGVVESIKALRDEAQLMTHEVTHLELLQNTLANDEFSKEAEPFVDITQVNVEEVREDLEKLARALEVIEGRELSLEATNELIVEPEAKTEADLELADVEAEELELYEEAEETEELEEEEEELEELEEEEAEDTEEADEESDEDTEEEAEEESEEESEDELEADEDSEDDSEAEEDSDEDQAGKKPNAAATLIPGTAATQLDQDAHQGQESSEFNGELPLVSAETNAETEVTAEVATEATAETEPATTPTPVLNLTAEDAKEVIRALGNIPEFIETVESKIAAGKASQASADVAEQPTAEQPTEEQQAVEQPATQAVEPMVVKPRSSKFKVFEPMTFGRRSSSSATSTASKTEASTPVATSTPTETSTPTSTSTSTTVDTHAATPEAVASDQEKSADSITEVVVLEVAPGIISAEGEAQVQELGTEVAQQAALLDFINETQDLFDNKERELYNQLTKDMQSLQETELQNSKSEQLQLKEVERNQIAEQVMSQVELGTEFIEIDDNFEEQFIPKTKQTSSQLQLPADSKVDKPEAKLESKSDTNSEASSELKSETLDLGEESRANLFGEYDLLFAPLEAETNSTTEHK